MRIKLRNHGKTLAVIMPKEILELLGVQKKAGAELEMRTNGKSLILTPANDQKKGKDAEDRL